MFDTAATENSWGYVFKEDGSYYLTPMCGSLTYRLHRVDDIQNSPTSTTLVNDQNLSHDIADPTTFVYDGVYYMLSFDNSANTHLWYDDTADSIEDVSWTEHHSSPVFSSTRQERPAGRPTVHEEFLDIYQMDNRRVYCDKIRQFRVTELTPSTWNATEVKQSPIVQADLSDNWNGESIHTWDPTTPLGVGGQVALTDGRASTGTAWALGIYAPTESRPADCITYLSSAQTIASGSEDKIQFDTVKRDEAQAFDTTNHEYVVPEDGKYEIKVTALHGSMNGTGPWKAEIDLRKTRGRIQNYAISHAEKAF